MLNLIYILPVLLFVAYVAISAHRIRTGKASGIFDFNNPDRFDVFASWTLTLVFPFAAFCKMIYG